MSLPLKLFHFLKKYFNIHGAKGNDSVANCHGFTLVGN